MTRQQIIKRAIRIAKERCSDCDDEALLAESVTEVLQEWDEEAAHDREVYGIGYDSPCIEDGRDNCNDSGTGEGRYHGRI